MVFERRPPSPSTQTSKMSVRKLEWVVGNDELTFSLDLVTLGEGEVGSQEIVVVNVGHSVR